MVKREYNWPAVFINLCDWIGVIAVTLIIASCVTGHNVL